jgi:chaperonin GroEL (HSP60 family)
MNHNHEWTRTDAELRIHEVLENAQKSGEAQRILDGNGVFEIRFLKEKTKVSAGEYLSRGGPED